MYAVGLGFFGLNKSLPPVFLLAVAITVGGTVYFASMAAMGMKWHRRCKR